jgi:hypothetical protein
MAHLRDSGLGRSHAVKEAPLAGTDEDFLPVFNLGLADHSA